MTYKEQIYYILVFIILNIILLLAFSSSYNDNIKQSIYLIEKSNPTQTLEQDLGTSIQIKDNIDSINISGMQFGNSILNYDMAITNIIRIHNKKYIITRSSLVDISVRIFNNTYYQVSVLILTINLIFMYYNIVYKKSVEKRHKKFMENKLHYQTTLILTENLHHELNTPITVITNKSKKLQMKINSIQQGTLLRDSCNIDESVNDFNAMNTSITLIRDIMDRMKSFKHMKVYESKRTVYEVIKSSCELVKVSQPDNFEYYIDDDLKKYKSNSKNLKNGELTGILVNHIKNSIEANASSIKFKLSNLSKNKSMLSFYVADNGNGIPAKSIDNIFSENSSSKDFDRGNGLYVNKFLIENAKGTLSLMSTSTKGTIFELSIPCIEATEDDIIRSESETDLIEDLEYEIANKETILQQVIDVLPDMVWFKNITGEYVIANKAIRQGLLFDDNPIGKDDILLANNAKLRFGEDNHTFGEKCANSDIITLKNDEPSRFLESGKVQGEMLYLEVNKAVVKDINGKVIGVCGSGRDLTEYIQSVKSMEETCEGCANNSVMQTFKKYEFENIENIQN